MVALTQDRNTPRRELTTHVDPVAAGVVIYQGALVCLDAAGNAVPGQTATGLKARGRAEERADNSAGNAGDKTVRTTTGVFLMHNDGADPVDRTHIGGDAWIVDDQTVAATDGDTGTGATRSKAGRIVDVDSAGVWVEIR